MYTPKMTSLLLLPFFCSWITFVGCIGDNEDPRIPNSHAPCGSYMEMGYYTPLTPFDEFYNAQDLEQDLVISRNVRSPDGPYKPVPLVKNTSLNRTLHSIGGKGIGSDDTRCTRIFSLLSHTKELENDPDGFEWEVNEIGLSLRNDFVFPDTLKAAEAEPETQNTPLVAHLAIEQNKTQTKDGLKLKDTTVQQVLNIQLSCDTPAVVKKNWAPKLDIDNPEFCKLNDQGEHICVEFRHTFDSKKCTFAQKVPFKIEQETVLAHIIGEININEDKKYSIHIEQISLPRP